MRDGREVERSRSDGRAEELTTGMQLDVGGSPVGNELVRSRSRPYSRSAHQDTVGAGVALRRRAVEPAARVGVLSFLAIAPYCHPFTRLTFRGRTRLAGRKVQVILRGGQAMAGEPAVRESAHLARLTAVQGKQP